MEPDLHGPGALTTSPNGVDPDLERGLERDLDLHHLGAHPPARPDPLLPAAYPSGHRLRPRDDWPSRLWRILSTTPLLALVVAAVLGAAGGLLGEWATLRGPTVWTSQTVMLIDQPYGIAVAGDSGVLLKLESIRVKYQGLAATNAIAGPVAARYGLPVSSVESSTAVVLPPDSLLLDVYGEWSSPAIAQNLSGAVAAEITGYVRSEDAQYNIPAADQFTITVVDPAAAATASGPSHSKAATVGLGVAVVVFALGFVLTQIARNRRLVA